MKKKILYGFFILLLLIQFIKIDKSKPSSDPSLDIGNVENVPNELLTILKNACYDCHSNETTYPWYTNVAPFSLLIGSHIKHGRQTMNFSTWGEYDEKKRSHYYDDMIEVMESKRMPMKTYVFLHSEAKLNDNDRKMIISFAKANR